MKIALDPGAILPTRAHPYDAGLDLYTPVDFTVYPADMASTFGGFFGGDMSAVTVDTGVHIQIPEGCAGFIKSKSGLNVNYGLTCEGVIDAHYTGSIKVKLYNHSKKGHKFVAGDKIAQLVILPCVLPPLELVDRLEETDRGNNGFGSTGR